MAKKRSPHGSPQSKRGSSEKVSVKNTPEKFRNDLKKVTLYIRHDQVIAIEEIQIAQRKLTGAKPDKSDLAQEAFDLLIGKYGA